MGVLMDRRDFFGIVAAPLLRHVGPPPDPIANVFRSLKALGPLRARPLTEPTHIVLSSEGLIAIDRLVRETYARYSTEAE